MESRASPVGVGGQDTTCQSEMALLIAESNSLPAPANVIKDVVLGFYDTPIDLKLLIAIKQL